MAIIPAASASQADIATAVATAVAGDTVTVPAQTVTWTGVLSVNKGITLQGAGIGQTVINDGRVRAESGNGNILLVDIPLGQAFRLTGFSFIGGSPATQGNTADGTVIIQGSSNAPAYRVDNCRFNQLTNVSIRFHGRLYGVTDHCIFVRHPLANTTINANHDAWTRDGGATFTDDQGDGSWAFPLAPGSGLAHYFEDNTFQNAAGLFTTSVLDSNIGARCVFRNNVGDWMSASSHGTDSGQRGRGQRWYEIYNNTFRFPGSSSSSSVDAVCWIRGGSGVVFNNSVTIDPGASLNWYVKHLNLRSNDPNHRNFPPWTNPGLTFPDCNGTAVWDGNSGDPSGAGYP